MRGPVLLICPILSQSGNFLNKSNFNLLIDKDLPLHIKENIPNASKEFINWFVGFADAEGCFTIFSNKSWTVAGFRFHIELHVDDINILHKIAETLGVGKVKLVKTRNSAEFSVSVFEDIVRVILPIFQEFPLQTTKYLDFTSFSEAVQIKLRSQSSGSRKIISKTDLIKIKNLKTNMNSGRLIINKEQLKDLENKVSINLWWLLGFVEGEGTFGYKHLVPYFQLAQHQKNLFVLKAIESFLIKLFSNVSPNAIGNKEFNIDYALNPQTGVYSMTVLKMDALFNYIVPLFNSMPFFTRKALDFHYWVISVIIHKYGYYYLPDGKKIALQISQSTNKYRYTSGKAGVNKVEFPSDDLVSKLLALPAPFDVTSGLSHFELVRKFTISKGGRKGFTVYIYERESGKDKKLTGSPFSTYGAGHVALGLKPGSRVVGRYIDTDKAYKGKYIFSSVPLSISEI